MNPSLITTHVLDTSRGRPAAGVPVKLEKHENGWKLLGQGNTDADGRLQNLLESGHTLKPGLYRLTFDTAAYFKSRKIEAFYPEVQVVFEVKDERHHHVPLLLSPYGYSTYRGS